VQFLGIILMFGGYMLVYAATAHGGQYATEPWATLYADAYIDNPYDLATLQAEVQAAGSGGIGHRPLPKTSTAGPGGRIKGRPRQ
jgi:hypothetical protein